MTTTTCDRGEGDRELGSSSSIGELRCVLNYLADVEPDTVMSKLEVGDLVRKVHCMGSKPDSFYEIDDVDVYMKLGEIDERIVHDGARAADYLAEHGEERDGCKVMPFSKVIENGVGECLERAVLVQLSAQQKRDVFLINGGFQVGDGFTEAHAYNVLFKDGQAYLVDLANPIEIDGSFRYFVEPIAGITIDREFELENNVEDRVYSLD